VLGERQDHGGGQKPISIAVLVAQFAAAGAVVLLALAVATAWLAREAGTRQAIDAAEQVAWVAARGVVEPRLESGVVGGDPRQLAEFDQAMRDFVIQGTLVRVRLRDRTGRVVYSDNQRIVGQTFPLTPEQESAMSNRTSLSEVSDLHRPENVDESSLDKLLEVDVGIRSLGGEALLFEALFSYDGVVSVGQAIWQRFAPVALGALLLLELVQIPFAYSLARRLQRQQEDRQRLLNRVVEASETERRRIAQDLHDGVVQELTAVTYQLEGARLRPRDPTEDQAQFAATLAQVGAAIAELRTLLFDIYPPDLTEEGLPASLTELAMELERTGLVVQLDVDQAAGLPAEPAAVLYRSAQEVLRNIAAHSDARHVDVVASVDGHTATLIVDDDGKGFDAAQLRTRLKDAHFGLRSVGDVVADAGGELTIESAPGHGTRAEIILPVS